MTLNKVLRYWNSADHAKSRSRRVAFGLANSIADLVFVSPYFSVFKLFWKLF
jgi:hypothetical protein